MMRATRAAQAEPPAYGERRSSGSKARVPGDGFRRQNETAQADSEYIPWYTDMPEAYSAPERSVHAASDEYGAPRLFGGSAVGEDEFGFQSRTGGLQKDRTQAARPVREAYPVRPVERTASSRRAEHRLKIRRKLNNR